MDGKEGEIQGCCDALGIEKLQICMLSNVILVSKLHRAIHKVFVENEAKMVDLKVLRQCFEESQIISEVPLL